MLYLGRCVRVEQKLVDQPGCLIVFWLDIGTFAILV